MTVDTDTMVSITEANQNFSKVARMADKYGSVLIMKNNAPSYILMEFHQAESTVPVSPEELRTSSAKIMKRNKKVYEELSKLKAPHELIEDDYE